MPIPSNPPFLSNVLGYAADVSVIPGTTPSGSGAFSYQSAFPQITAIPLTAGGVAPMREDFNAVFKLLSQHVHFLQSGSLYPWSASLDYLVGAHVLGSDGNEYIAQKSNGPGVPDSSAIDPVGDESGTWVSAKQLFSTGIATALETGVASFPSPMTITEDGKVGVRSATLNQTGIVQLTNSLDSKTDLLAASDTAVASLKNQLDAALSAAGTVTLKGSRSTTGQWTLTGLAVGKPLYILASNTDTTEEYSYIFLKVLAGADAGTSASNVYARYFFVGGGQSNSGTDAFITIPTANTVVIDLTNLEGMISLYAYQ